MAYFGVVSLVLGLVILPSWRERGAELAGRLLGPLRRFRPAAPKPSVPSRWQVELAAALDADTLPLRHGVL
ncbi:peptidase M15, partial [Rubrivivax gelatinosus]|nr:peptidase M15 [Rubrivivax gelatinosus]